MVRRKLGAFATMKPAYLGFDFSTQQLKMVLCDDDLRLLGECAVQFETDLPQYKTAGGVHRTGSRVTSPVRMWIEAVDLLFDKAAQQFHGSLDYSSVKAVSGCGQQHGSVYWCSGAAEKLRALDADERLVDNLRDCFAIDDSPIWMDASTDDQCALFDRALGGAEVLARVTGSRAYHRFTGPQILKIMQQQPAAYESTERISLVSSFACSLFLGDYAPIDYSDGSGMNLFDLHTNKWHEDLLKAVVTHGCRETLERKEFEAKVDELKRKLDSPVDGTSVLGSISAYFVKRYGFSPECRVVVFTGDNPSAFCGMAVATNEAFVSWGTSDTVLCSGVDLPSLNVDCKCVRYPLLNVHLMVDPVNDGGKCVAMLCFKNGAFTRERVRREVCGAATWDDFNMLVENQSVPGNQGNLGFYYDFPEILPNLKEPGDWRFDHNDKLVCCIIPPLCCPSLY